MTVHLATRLSSLMFEARITAFVLGAFLLAGVACTGEHVRDGEGRDAAGAKDGQKDEAKAEKLRAEIARLIKELGHQEWSVREAAQKRLLRIGRPAAPALRIAAGSDDLEVSTRARAVLKEVLGQGWLGVEIRDPDASDRRGRSIPGEGGVIAVRVLEDTPAAKAKLLAGDLLYSLDGRVIKDSPGMVDMVVRTEPETKAKLVIYRNGEKTELEVVIGRRPKGHERP